MKYFIIAGEASGDLHASNLMRELKIADTEAQFQFLGGDKMEEIATRKPLIHYKEMSFMGFIAVARNLKTVLTNMKRCKQAIWDFRPDVVILVDYPSFNLRIAEFVKKELPTTKVYYYISPKIWAWKEYRIKSIKKYIDEMFTIFPFETDFYKRHHYKVNYVGNPTVDFLHSYPNLSVNLSQFCEENKMPEKPIIALLPGSRKQEVQHCLPKMLLACQEFANTHQIVIGKAPAIEMEMYQKIIAEREINIVENKTIELLANSEVAVVNSGTASLETGVLKIPQVVVYHVGGGKFTLWLKDILLKVKYISLVNLIANKMVIKELIGYYFTKENLQKELKELLFNQNYRNEMLKNYSQVLEQLGTTPTAENAARLMVQKLKA